MGGQRGNGNWWPSQAAPLCSSIFDSMTASQLRLS